MRKLSIISALVFLFGMTAIGQSQLDSFWSIWQNEDYADTTRLKAIKEFTWNGYLFSQPDSAFYYAQIMYELADQQNLPFYRTQALNMQGVSYYFRGDYMKAIDYYTRGYEIADRTGDLDGMSNTSANIGSCYRNMGEYDKAFEFENRSLSIDEKRGNKKGIAQSLSNIGVLHRRRGDLPQALDYYLRSIKIKEELGDKRGVANSLNSIGLIYKDLEDYPTAMEYYSQSLNIREELNDKNRVAGSLINIGGIYFLQNDFTTAEEYFNRGLETYETVGDKSGIALALGNLGVVYDSIQQYAKAIDFHFRGLEIRKEIDNKQGIAESMINIGESYKNQKNFAKSTNWCHQALQVAEEIGAVTDIQLACDCLYHSYKSQKNDRQALFYFEKSRSILDSLKSEETGRRLQQMEFDKQILADSLTYAEKELLSEKKHQSELRRKDRLNNYAIATGIILLLAAFGLWSRLRYIRKSREEIRKEKDRSESLLLNILPAEVASELKENGKAAARDFNMVSILFTDFKEFTQASERLSAQDLVSEINICFEAFDNICEKYQVEKIKTIGDSYMAAGGLPIPSEDSVKRSVLAALDMCEFILDRKKELEDQGLKPFEMRVGINTGPVVAGIVGVKKFQYDIWGDTVNTAARVESNGLVGKVNISESTYDAIKSDPDFVFESRGNILTKGKGEIKMYFVDRYNSHQL